MSRLVFYLAFALGVWTGAEVLQDDCEPSCSNSNPGDHVPDPTNCKRYYICLENGNPSDFTTECPDDEKFDNTTRTCLTEDKVTCGVCEPSCIFTCPANLTIPIIIADSIDCHHFVVCAPGNDPTRAPCDDDKPYFNGTSCTTDSSQCCDPCVPYCTDAYIEIPDPTDCTSFYFCESKGYPDDTSRYHCDDGNFDPTVGTCSTEAECNEPCAGGGNTSTITTSPYTTTEGTTASDDALCVDTFVCKDVGYFPKCTNRCDKHYYTCTASDIGSPVDPVSCSGGRVLNPDTMSCMSVEECPYPYHE